MWGLHFRAEDPESQISYVPCLGPTAGDEQGAHGPDRSTCPRRSPAGDQGLPGRDLGTTWGQDGPEATAVVLRAPPPVRGAPACPWGPRESRQLCLSEQLGPKCHPPICPRRPACCPHGESARGQGQGGPVGPQQGSASRAQSQAEAGDRPAPVRPSDRKTALTSMGLYSKAIGILVF